jgi:hypothetical protein
MQSYKHLLELITYRYGDRWPPVIIRKETEQNKPNRDPTSKWGWSMFVSGQWKLYLMEV